jgi:hypothetical protein
MKSSGSYLGEVEVIKYLCSRELGGWMKMKRNLLRKGDDEAAPLISGVFSSKFVTFFGLFDAYNCTE